MRTAATPTRRWLRRVLLGGALAGILAVVIVGSGVAAAKAKPVNNSAPKIFGAARVGQVLSGDRGDWTNVSSYAYAWLRCNANGNGCNPISGATGTTYQLTSADDGHRIRFRVTATNGEGSTVATTAATAVVTQSAKPANTALPAISGTPQEGSTLTGSNGTWTNSPSKFDYAWLRCDNKGNSCATVNGANKNTYVIASGDVNTTIRFRVTATNSAGNETATSNPTAVIGKNRGPGCPAGGNPDQVANINGPARLLVDLAHRDGNPGVICRRLNDPGVVELVHGNELLGGRESGYDMDLKREHPQYTVDLVYGCIRETAAPAGFPQVQSLTGFDVWAGYLVFDAWIANTDRHHENWGVLVHRRDGSRRLAPSFDHGSSLGFNESPSRMATKALDARDLERWCSRGRSGHFAGRPNLVDVAAAALDLAGHDAWLHWMAQLRQLRREDWTTVIGRVPAARMSEDARTFVSSVLDVNRRRLLDVCDRAA